MIPSLNLDLKIFNYLSLHLVFCAFLYQVNFCKVFPEDIVFFLSFFMFAGALSLEQLYGSQPNSHTRWRGGLARILLKMGVPYGSHLGKTLFYCFGWFNTGKFSFFYCCWKSLHMNISIFSRGAFFYFLSKVTYILRYLKFVKFCLHQLGISSWQVWALPS